LLFFVIPPLEIPIPTLGINRLFELDQVRLMGLTVLFPAAWARVEAAGRGERLHFTAVDALLLGYGLLQLMLLFPYEVVTNTMRRAFLYFLDTYLVYFAFSRLNARRDLLTDSLGALCLSACIFAPLAVFETLRHWLLYIGIGELWGAPNLEAYLLRGDSLRAQVSTGHAIPLGYVLAMAVGCWMYLRSTQPTKSANPFVFGLLALGIYVSYSRGPWLAAVLVPFVFLALSSRSAANFAKGALVFGAVVGAVLVSPLGPGILANLPFIGTAGQETVEYRQQLAETSWRLIQQNPWFGNPFVMLQMEELRQGQGGIIDLVNAYATVALFYGLVGLALFMGAFVVGLADAYKALRSARAAYELDSVMLGASLIACVVGTLFVMAAGGFAWFQWLLLGLLMAYARAQTAEAFSGGRMLDAGVGWATARRRPRPTPF
jgi:O-antigen ligase